MSDEMTDAQKLLHLADWLDLRFPDRPGEDEVQRDLRRIAAALATAARERDEARALCAPRPGMAAVEADLKDSLRLAWERLDEARQHGDSARARAGRAEALNVELVGALDSLLGLGLDCFASGDTAPRDGCGCNTCETVREGRVALEKAGTK